MSGEERKGLQSILAVPGAYRCFTRLIGGGSKSVYLGAYVRPRPGDRILDIGCGPGDMVAHLPAVHYVGIDADERYIRAAHACYGQRGRFIHTRIQDAVLDEPGTYDIAMANGVLHHLDDEVARSLFCLARQALRPGGRLVSFDGCFRQGQALVARLLLRLDRGRFVRTGAGYIALAQQLFPRVEVHFREDLLRVPYTHIILECHA